MAAQGEKKYICCALFLTAVFSSSSVGLDAVAAGDEKEISKTKDSGEDAVPHEEIKKLPSAPEKTSATPSSKRPAEDVTDECLKYVNYFRHDHISDPLAAVLPNKALENYITSRMAELAEKNCSGIELKTLPGVGATFYAISGEKPSCKKATHLWYRQIYNLHGTYPGTTWDVKSLGEFSQMMWHSSRFLACARTTECTAGFNQLACFYYPAGNVLGEAPFSEKVWQEIAERHAKWTGQDLAQSTRTTTTTAIPSDPPISYLMESLSEALEQLEKEKESQ